MKLSLDGNTGQKFQLTVRSIIEKMHRLPVILLLCSVLIPLSVSGQSYFREKKLTIDQPNIDEMAPVLFGNSLIFNSNREQNASFQSKTDDEGRNFFHRYYSTFDSDWNFAVAKEFAPGLATDRHDGPVAFTPDEETICFVMMYASEDEEEDRNANAYSGLYFADFDGEEWINVRPFPFNDPAVNFYSPCFSRDGQKLFFAANFEDSRGGLDLYVSVKQNGEWTRPVNLGDQVNTTLNEFYPFSHPSGKLYFCSEGHDQGGGKDLFVSVEIAGVWQRPEKLGNFFNSAADDYSLIMSDDYSSGFLVSTKRGGSKDIFRFYSTIPDFPAPKEQEVNKFCYLLKENSADTADPALYDYFWVINDTLTLNGREVSYCFPGPGFYDLRFNVHNKLIDSMMLNQASYQLTLSNKIQAYISCPDTATVRTAISFDARQTNLPEFDIGQYYWDFGDGEPRGEGIEVRHSYKYPGKYKVVLGVEERVRNRRDEPLRKAYFKEIIIIPPN